MDTVSKQHGSTLVSDAGRGRAQTGKWSPLTDVTTEVDAIGRHQPGTDHADIE
jgi:hypothetical protein